MADTGTQNNEKPNGTPPNFDQGFEKPKGTPPTEKRKDRGIFQNKRGDYVIEWYVNRERFRKVIGKSKTEAKAVLQREKEAARVAKLFPEKVAGDRAKELEKLTVGDLVARFAAQLRNNKSWKAPQKSGELAAAYFGKKPIGQITAEDVEAFKIYRQSCQVDRKYKDPAKHAARPLLKPATVNRDLARLKTLFNLAVANKLLVANPMSKTVKMLAEENMRYEFLTTQQQKLFRPHLSQAKYRMLRFNCLTGLRTTELLTLRRSMCSLSNATLTIPITKSKKKAGRIVHLGPKALALLKVILAGHTSEWVFPSKVDGPIKRRNWNRTFDRARAKVIAKLKEENSPMLGDFPQTATPYTCRHTYGSLSAAAGIDVNVIKSQMGHSSLLVTERYMHHAPSHMKRSVKLYG